MDLIECTFLYLYVGRFSYVPSPSWNLLGHLQLLDLKKFLTLVAQNMQERPATMLKWKQKWVFQMPQPCHGTSPTKSAFKQCFFTCE